MKWALLIGLLAGVWCGPSQGACAPSLAIVDLFIDLDKVLVFRKAGDLPVRSEKPLIVVTSFGAFYYFQSDVDAIGSLLEMSEVRVSIFSASSAQRNEQILMGLFAGQKSLWERLEGRVFSDPDQVEHTIATNLKIPLKDLLSPSIVARLPGFDIHNCLLLDDGQTMPKDQFLSWVPMGKKSAKHFIPTLAEFPEFLRVVIAMRDTGSQTPFRELVRRHLIAHF